MRRWNHGTWPLDLSGLDSVGRFSLAACLPSVSELVSASGSPPSSSVSCGVGVSSSPTSSPLSVASVSVAVSASPAIVATPVYAIGLYNSARERLSPTHQGAQAMPSVCQGGTEGLSQ